ncbi:MAG TPA: L-seryl-tRNA(Sec) selenium transferase, partial [Syntrophales bacterium]|nr:L-seryl-tRNA(Sec) selenium transferase [Syntrophales bacterium]
SDAVQRLVEIGRGYSNLEYDLNKGERGLRYDHVQKILCELSGAEDTLVVNNNAAAVLLTLNTLAEGREVVVSRGELVEIGGEFRIPEVMEKSGARLREVGTTNRTRIADYKRVMGPETGLILKVHTSNFKIVGFTEDTDLISLVSLGRNHGIPVMYDLGSGCFTELDRYGLEREPTVGDVLKTGVDVITFSGDKLLGGPQAGIILGKNDILQKIKKNPLTRALRIDKLTLAALEATMMQYLQSERAVSNLRVLKALTEPLADVIKRAKKLLSMLRREHFDGIVLSLNKGFSMPGGGSLPTQEIPTMLLSVVSKQMSPSSLEERFRQLDIPIIARIAEDEVLFDLRTIEEQEFPYIRDGLKKIASSYGTDR